MKLGFYGAAHEVTGSCSLLEVGGRKGIVDFGMEQGKDLFVNVPLPVAPADLDFVTTFLFNTKEGYCTYFATAMTVLCRMAGLPAIRQIALNIPILLAMNALFGMTGIVWTQAVADIANVVVSYIIYGRVMRQINSREEKT